MKLRIPCLLIATLLTFSAKAQSSFGIKASLGFSNIYSNYKKYQPTLGDVKYVPQVSGEAGFCYNYSQVKSKLMIGAEALLVSSNANQFVKRPPYAFNTNATAYYIVNTYTHLYYIGIPIYVGYRFDKIILNFGLQSNFSLLSNEKIKSDLYVNDALYASNEGIKNIKIPFYSFTVRSSIQYKLTNIISVEASYSYGLSNIIPSNYRNNLIPYKWQMQQLTAGLRMMLLNNIKNKQ